jgi:hypothetical protein
MFAVIPGTFGSEVGVEMLRYAVKMGEKGIVAGGGFEKGLVKIAQNTNWIAAGCLPKIAIKSTEEVDRSVIPAPAKVVGNWQ